MSEFELAMAETGICIAGIATMFSVIYLFLHSWLDAVESVIVAILPGLALGNVSRFWR